MVQRITNNHASSSLSTKVTIHLHCFIWVTPAADNVCTFTLYDLFKERLYEQYFSEVAHLIVSIVKFSLPRRPNVQILHCKIKQSKASPGLYGRNGIFNTIVY